MIPVYNGSNFIHNAIESALSQTYDNVEVIVINDGSDDGGLTESIVSSYDHRIRYFSKPNGGVSSALNLGIEKMTGDWFAWLSHDDAFSKNRIASDMTLARQNDQIKIIFCKIKIIDANGSFIKEIQYPIDKVTNPREALMLNGVDMCTMTLHRTCFDSIGRFNEHNFITQDVEMTLRLSKKFHFHLNPHTTTYKREHAKRGTYVYENRRRKDIIQLCDLIHDHFSISDFFPDMGSAKDEMANCWHWLGNFYKGFDMLEYAEECYANAARSTAQYDCKNHE